MTKWIPIVMLMLAGHSASATDHRGGLVLQFDDGWTSWATTIAPAVKEVCGVATCFVNNQNIKSGRITRGDLLELQNTYHWEIGTHTWHHLNAPIYAKKSGLTQWTNQELMKSLAELRDMGLNVRSLVFPFNAYTPELSKSVQPLVESYRKSEVLALADGLSADKSVPGTAIDMAHYVPPQLLKKWIDLASEQDTLLFLYGHRVLPDSCFATGKVVSVTETTLTAEMAVELPGGMDLVLVPDSTRRQVTPDYFHVEKVAGNVITVDRPNLTTATQAGSEFMIGEAYSTRLSDFKAMLSYAASRLNFYTLHDVVEGKHRPAKP